MKGILSYYFGILLQTNNFEYSTKKTISQVNKRKVIQEFIKLQNVHFGTLNCAFNTLN